MGTNISPPTPRKKIMRRCTRVKASALSSADAAIAGSLPFNIYCMMKAGTSIDTNEGTKISVITPTVVIEPAIQSMMVVTSPMGEKAPPELAAIITNAAYTIRSCLSATSLRNTIIITMLVVRLSRMADRKKVIKAMRHNSPRLLCVCMESRTKLNPPLVSTTSTMVIAPMRKNSVSAVSPKCSLRLSPTCANIPAALPVNSGMPGNTNSDGLTMKSVQQATHIKSATGALFTFVKLSRAMQR